MKSISEVISENSRVDEAELKEYNVLIGISGVASAKIKAKDPEEAKKLLLRNTNTIGENDFYWWFDKKNPVVAVSETEDGCPQVIDIEELKDNGEWMFV